MGQHMTETTSVERMRLMGPLFMVLAVVLFVGNARRLVHLGPSLSEVGVTTASVGAEQGAFSGGWLLIEVDGATHRCPAEGKQPVPGVGVEVLYEPSDPSHCREAELVGTISSHEGMSLVMGVAFLLVGTFGTVALVTGALRKRRRMREIMGGID